ncbi:murein biosynthesis integral membrane protein MurJ, partial [Agrobacterium vitis]
MSLVKKFMTVGGATLGSRLFGFARETLMAAALGTGPMADVFYAAFRFPNLFRRLFAEGAFNAAFVPLFSKEIEANGLDGAKRFSEEVFGVLFTVLLLITIAMELSMPLLVRFVIAPGFADDAEKFSLTVRLAVVMFPYLMCMSLTAMLSGMLNSLHHFFAAAVAPIFLNLVMISALFYALYHGVEPVVTAWYLSWSVLVAGILQLLVVYIGVRHAGIRLGFKWPKITPNVKRLLVLAVPAAVTGGITQINQLIGQAIASSKDGAIAALQYADRIYQLPLGVVGVAVG